MVDDTETSEAMAKELADRAPRKTVRPLLASLAGEHNLDRIRHHVERGAEQTGRDLRSIRRSYNVMGATDPAAAPLGWQSRWLAAAHSGGATIAHTART